MKNTITKIIFIGATILNLQAVQAATGYSMKTSSMGPVNCRDTSNTTLDKYLEAARTTFPDIKSTDFNVQTLMQHGTGCNPGSCHTYTTCSLVVTSTGSYEIHQRAEWANTTSTEKCQAFAQSAMQGKTVLSWYAGASAGGCSASYFEVIRN